VKIVLEAADAREGRALAEKHGPDIVVMEIKMPGPSSIEAMGRIRETAPGTRILVLSMCSDPRCVKEAVRAGASGYVLKECGYKELLSAIRSITRGETYFCSRIPPSATNLTSPSRSASLTGRELQVLQLLAEGKSTRQIASILGVSVKTVETHRKRIMEKVNLYTVAELTKFAIREGITSPDV
jgi:DNA-binding NarL/FixJ family response regulator